MQAAFSMPCANGDGEKGLSVKDLRHLLAADQHERVWQSVVNVRTSRPQPDSSHFSQPARRGRHAAIREGHEAR